MGAYGTFDVVFREAQPTFKINFMYITGTPDEKEFDKLAEQMHLRDIAPKIKCPMLLLHGEYDELCPAQAALTYYETLKCPKELWMYENEFHPLGGVAPEMIGCAADWLLDKLEGKYNPNMDNAIFIKTDGTRLKGTGKPPWWQA